MKKVLLVIVDALATRVVGPALDRGDLPNFKRLVEAGRYQPNCSSIFPSITPAATSSLATGCYPRDHGVVGCYWYDTRADRVHYFGDDIWAIWNRGISSFTGDFTIRLNEEYLSATTVFEHVQRADRRAACLNYLIVRGDTSHPLNAPLLLKLWPGVTFPERVQGPDILCLGDFVSTPADPSGQDPQAPGGMSRRYGFHDEATEAYLLQMAEADRFPDLTLAYFPNNDFESHENGAQAALSTVQKVDHTLGALVDAFGGLDRLLNEMAVLITGDHSQSDLTNGGGGIDLDDALQGYTVVAAGDQWGSDEDVMVCPNMRAAAVYWRSGESPPHGMVQRLLCQDRVDQVIWPETDGQGARLFHVATRDRGRLEFWPRDGDDSQSEASAIDAQGTRWAWRGDLAALDLQAADGRLAEGDYPNPLERIAGSFRGDVPQLWATARIGYEFVLPETTDHRKGSHGSLHALDSISPLISAGVPDEVTWPESPRNVDVAPLCLSILGIRDTSPTFPRPTGAVS